MMNEETKKKLYASIKRFDLQSYIEANFVKVVPSGSSELRVDCFAPNGCASGDTKAHLWINVEKKAWICYKCGYGDNGVQRGTGWIPRLIADVEGVPIRVAIQRLLDDYEPTPDEDLEAALERSFAAFEAEEETTSRAAPSMAIPRQFYRLSAAGGITSGKFRAYAAKRGFDALMQSLYDLHYCVAKIPSLPEKYQSSFVSRLIWPIYDQEGVCRSAVARDITGSRRRPRWVTWPDTEPADFFWPLGRWLNGKFFPNSFPKRVVLTEGIIDAHAIYCLTDRVAKACFGKKISDAQIELLNSNRVKEIILAWDYEAKDKMINAVERLTPFFHVFVFPYRHPAWSSSAKTDLGDALDPTSEVHQVVHEELESAIDVDSPEFCAWVNS